MTAPDAPEERLIADDVARPWWWNDPATRAWIASGACCCRSCRAGRRAIEEERS